MTEAAYRLSPSQRRVWSRREADGPAGYRTWGLALVEGRVDEEKLRAALETLPRDHEILRTSFVRRPGVAGALQAVGEPRVVWRDPAAATLDDDATFVAGLERLAPDRARVFLGAPSLALDVESVAALVAELAAAYAGESRTDEPLQYADAAEWQNELLESEETQRGRDYWSREVGRGYSSRGLAQERARPQRAYVTDSVVVEPPAALLATIERASSSGPGGMRDFLLSAWQALLVRFTSESGGAVGLRLDGRVHRELEDAVGLYARYVPLRCPFDESSSFAEAWRLVHEQAETAAGRQAWWSWEELSESFRDDSAAPFLPYGFAFLPEPPSFDGGEATLRILERGERIDRFKLRLEWRGGIESSAAALEYDIGVFDRREVERIADCWLALLQHAAEEPERSVGTLRLLGSAERERLLAAEIAAPAPQPERCVHELFEAHARTSPDRLAVAFEHDALTYRELDRQANGLAKELRSAGARPDAIVALCLERSARIVVALLAALKAGAAYLPLDPVLPPARLRFMLEASGAAVLVGDAPTLAALRRESPLRINQVPLGADEPPVADESPPPSAAPDNLAYVMFTSGSTGRPKGVAVTHRSIVNYALRVGERLELAEATHALVSTFAADLGHTSLFGALCNGGALEVVAPERCADADALAERIRSRSVDCLKITPSHLAALLTAADPAAALPARSLVVGGEALRWELVEQVRALAPSCRIFNHYGPTETTVGVLAHEVPELPDEPRSGTVPLGHPFDNVAVHVLDRELEPLPAGAVGEICVGGVALARGYVGDAALTATRFVPDRFAHPPGGRLYRTGDLGRRRPDGTIEFLGRVDDQVKIRGFRVEPREVESALLAHPGLRDAAVLPHRTEQDEVELFAYVVPGTGARPSTSELRDSLRSVLGDFMIPSGFVVLDELPRTPNGKLDRRRLPAGRRDRAELGVEYVAPQTDVERALVEIWQELLEVERVGIHDDFLELGGHSLLVMRVVARVRDAFGVDLPLHRLFDARTVAALAEIVEEEKARPTATEPAIAAVDRSRFRVTQSELGAEERVRSR